MKRAAIILTVLVANVLAVTAQGNGVWVSLDMAQSSTGGYLAMMPVNGIPEAYLLLMPGFGESPADVMGSTTLPQEAAAAGIAVFIPVLKDGVKSYGFTPASQRTLARIVNDIKCRYKLHDTPLCLGGFSIGGAAAIKFAEDTTTKPACVFAIDSPLDFERFLMATRRDVEIYKKGDAEGGEIYNKLLEDIAPIIHDSPYLLSDTTHASILSLKETPIRYYIEPAEQWWLDNRQTDVLGLNILDATAFINDLRLIGNNHAELIVTSGKGRRGSNYHPHSWTIVDNEELIRWIIQQSTNNK